MKLPPRFLYGAAAGCLSMSLVGFVEWLRLQLKLGMSYQAAKAGVPYQNVNLKVADAVNLLSDEWLAVAFAGVILSGLALMMALKLKAPQAQARAFWGGGR